MIKFKSGIKGDGTFVDEKAKTMEESKDFEDPEAFYNSLLAENCDAAKGWVKSLDMKETDKVPVSMQMHMRPIEGRSIKMIRTDAVFKGIDKSQFVGFMDDFQNNRSDPNIIKMETFEKKDGYQILYIQSKMPMMMTNRDSLLSLEKIDKEDGRLLFVIRTVKRDDLMPEQEGFIRMEQCKASMSEQKGEDLHMTEFSNMNLKGYFPVRLMNMVLGSMIQAGIGQMYEKMKAQPVKKW